MRCLNCGNKKNVTDLSDPTKNADEMDVAEFRCASCGAGLQTRENITTARCVFCGSDVLLPARMARTKRPEWIVPFKITREECEKRFRAHLKKAKYAPSGLTGKDSIGNFMPVYIPYWDYSLDGAGENLGDARSRRPGRRPGPGAADRRSLHALFVPSSQRVPYGNTA